MVGFCGKLLSILLCSQYLVFSGLCESERLKLKARNFIEETISKCCSTPFGYLNECQPDVEVDTGSELLSWSNSELPQHFFINANAKQQNGSIAGTLISLDRLKTSLPNCGSSVRGSINILSLPILASDTNHTVVDPPGRFDVESGSLHYNNEIYAPQQYCLNGLNKDEVQVVLCNPDLDCSNSQRTCIRKCCPSGKYMLVGDNRINCVHSKGKEWVPPLYQNTNPNLMLIPEDRRNSSFRFIYSHPSLGWCGGDAFFMYEKDYPGHPKMPFRIQKNGNVVFETRHGGWEHLDPNSYCVDGVYPNIDDNDVKDFQESVIFHCKSDEDLPEESPTMTVTKYFIILAAISAVFILFTIVIYGLLWEAQNIHRWTLLSFFTSLFFMYVFLICMYMSQLGWYFENRPGELTCEGMGIALHFAYLSTFSWLSVLNFDLWCTFRNLRGSASKISKRFKRFALYFVFATGVPSTVVGTTIAVDIISKNRTDIPISKAFIPEYGLHRCFLSSEEPSLIYLYGPISVLLVINLLSFILTVRAICQIKKATNIARRNSTNNGHTQSVHLFGKLFVVMGVTWIFEVITWATHPTTVPWWYIPLDLVNACHGIFIFVIFVCKRSTFRSLEQKYPSFKRLTNSLESILVSIPKSNVLCCNRIRNLTRTQTFNTSQEMTERRKSNETDLSTICASEVPKHFEATCVLST